MRTRDPRILARIVLLTLSVLPAAGWVVHTEEPAPARQPGPTAGEPAAQPSPTVPPPIPPAASAPAPAAPPAPGDAEIAEGLELLQHGNLAEAEAHLNKALTLDPGSAVARSRLAYIRFRKADYAGAANLADAATHLDPSDALAWLILGRSKEALGDGPGAAAAYSAAAAITATASTQEQLVAGALGHYLRAMRSIEAGTYEGVEADLAETLQAYPKNAYALYEYGLALLKSGKAEDAAQALQQVAERASEFHPQETWVYPNRRYFFIEPNIQFWRGVALRQAGRLDEAITALESVLPKVESLAGSTTTAQLSPSAAKLEGKLDRSFYGAYYEAALAYEARGRKDEALALLKRFLKLNLGAADLVQRVKDLQKRLKQ